METVRAILTGWSQSMSEAVSVGGLLARDPVAHKWKAPYRSFVIREALLWRMHDLGQQTLLLADKGHILGARILWRAAIETLAVLIYLNQKTQAVLDGTLSFFEFDELTKKLLMGSRNGATNVVSINIMTVLDKAAKAHPGLLQMYEDLSESVHPNYDGVTYGYTSTNYDELETRFVNNWVEFFGELQEPGTAFVLAVFENEYNSVWTGLFGELEKWLGNNDQALEAQRQPD